MIWQSLSKNIESGAFNGLENLKELYMRENEIRSLPENLFGTELIFIARKVSTVCNPQIFE